MWPSRPDPKNPLNDVSTMNKTLEYMAFEVPVVAFDLKETRVSAGEAAAYVADGDVAGYARAVVELLDDDVRRGVMGRIGRARIEDELGWPHQRTAYVGVYDAAAGRAATPGSGSSSYRRRCARPRAAQAGAPREWLRCVASPGVPAADGERLVGTMADASPTAGRTRRGIRDLVRRSAGRSWPTAGCRSSTCPPRPTSRSSRTGCT